MDSKEITRRQFNNLALGLGAAATVGMGAEERAQQQELSPEDMVDAAYTQLVDAYQIALANEDRVTANNITLQISVAENRRRNALNNMPPISLERTLDTMFVNNMSKLEFADEGQMRGNVGITTFVAGNEFFRINGELNPDERNGTFRYFVDYLEVGSNNQWFVTKQRPIAFTTPESLRTTVVIEAEQISEHNPGLDITFSLGGDPGLFIVKGIELVPKQE